MFSCVEVSIYIVHFPADRHPTVVGLVMQSQFLWWHLYDFAFQSSKVFSGISQSGRYF